MGWLIIMIAIPIGVQIRRPGFITYMVAIVYIGIRILIFKGIG